MVHLPVYVTVTFTPDCSAAGVTVAAVRMTPTISITGATRVIDEVIAMHSLPTGRLTEEEPWPFDGHDRWGESGSDWSERTCGRRRLTQLRYELRQPWAGRASAEAIERSSSSSSEPADH